MRLLLGLFAVAGVPEPASDEARPLAPAAEEWLDRSGALLTGGAAALFSSPTGPLALASLRAGMHDYDFEWSAGGSVGTPLDGTEGALFELLVAPGARVPIGGRLSVPARLLVGVLSTPTHEGRERSFLLGIEGGLELALDGMLRVELVGSLRTATGLEDDGMTPMGGISAAVTAIP